MNNNPRIDVATLVTSLTLIGFAILGGLVAWGHTLIQPASMWFALVLLASGFIGLAFALPRRDDKRGTNHRKKE